MEELRKKYNLKINDSDIKKSHSESIKKATSEKTNSSN